MTTNRIRAGSVPPLELHRTLPEQMNNDRAVMYAQQVPTPIQFAGDEPDDTPTAREFTADVLASTWAFWASSIAMWTFICFGAGWMAHRFFS